jgi:ubiquitin-like-conjugating enzyme ATG3
MGSIGHSIADLYRKVASTFTSASGDSRFREAGTLTAEEFVEAGEQLVRRCPTWSWQTSSPGYEQPHLPRDKQCLITRGVPCRRRASRADLEVIETTTDDGWIVTRFIGQEEEPVDLASELRDSGEERGQSDNEEEVDEDPNALPAIFQKEGYVSMDAPVDQILRTRVYDLSITYDKYYQTPRLWLTGYDEHHSPLSVDLMFQDIMDDYAGKTVTLETHPCLGSSQLSVHPCNHAPMMKHFVDVIESNGARAEVRAYLFVFLKFLASVVPTVEYDFTINFELA